jgi:predicted CXXCH cytochrome family protein
LLAVVAVVGATAIGGCKMVQQASVPPLPVVDGATPVGTETCVGCHEDIPGTYKGDPHAFGVVKRADGCETCHGAGSKHASSQAATDIVGAETLRALSAPARSALCLSCHADQVGHFPQSEHAVAGVSCWDCHPSALHGAKTTAVATLPDATGIQLPAWRRLPSLMPGHGSGASEFCYQCHGEVEADFRLQFHHPVLEGQMRCTDCHEILGKDLLTAIDDGRERCLSCHEEIRGPFLFEHLALEEGCTACHTPHGSIVKKLLTEANNGLCERCHFDARFPLIGGVDHTPFLSGGALCYDCHAETHGSNTTESLIPLNLGQRLIGGGRRQ